MKPLSLSQILLLEKEINDHKGGVSKSLQRIGIVSAATVLSRLLGFLRDVLTFAVFGTSALNSAFLFAFTLPNLFRRLLGEGALTAALVPTLTEEMDESGRAGAFALLSKVFSWLFLITTALVVVGIGAFLAIPLIPGLPERWYLSSGLAVFLFPYLIFVCLAALLGAALNVLSRFAIPALSAVWLNLAIIVLLGGFGLFFAETDEGRMIFLCAGVLTGGFLQLAIPLAALMREGWRPAPDLKRSPRLKEIYVLMLPGLAGTAIFQINVVVSRSLAFGVDESAVAVLYLANRLMEFPLGIFTIAVATVIFPLLSQHAVRGDVASYVGVYRKGLGLILLITLPAAAGILVLAEPIVGLFFERGAFGVDDTALTVPVLGIFALTLPFYSIATFATRGFHSVKNTSTPVRIAGLSFLVNLAFSLLLMIPYGMIGLALANLISIVAQSLFLQVRFALSRGGLNLASLRMDTVKMAAAAIAMGLLVWAAAGWLQELGGGGKTGYALALGGTIPGGVLFYFGAVWLLRVEGRREVEPFLRRFARSRAPGGTNGRPGGSAE
jgi:putative peptidoglycan lipid II flippase